MAITINHPFVSAKGDGSDATLVRPSNWNASHNLNMATNRVIGRLTAGPGLAEELPVTSYMMALLNTADFAALAAALGLPTTGDGKLTFKTVADAGWVMANDGSIGDAGSGASYMLPTYNTQALFTLFFNNVNDTNAPIQTSAGGATTRAAQVNAANAWAAKCRMLLPRQLGRAIIVAGAGATLTSRPLGSWAGEEGHVMTLAELPKHTHTGTNWSGSGSGGAASGSGTVSISGSITGVPALGTLAVVSGGAHNHAMYLNDPGHYHSYDPRDGGARMSNQFANGASNPLGAQTDTKFTGITIGSSPGVGDNVTTNHTGHSHTFSGALTAGTLAYSISSATCTINSVTVGISNIGGTTDVMGTGGGAANVMQPYTAWNVMIKL